MNPGESSIFSPRENENMTEDRGSYYVNKRGIPEQISVAFVQRESGSEEPFKSRPGHVD